MDCRWQLVLDCLNCEAPHFAKWALVSVQTRQIVHDFDRCLIESTLVLATQRDGFSPRELRAALDSSPV